ncbi:MULTISPECIES: hypothetical protein [unclassified Novosphingobium]|uniref:hypothetical protein n=1 Tax=unclassified Novosphingobium TaxID=2644732 RepID=UPI001358A1D3|nr:MULTISPECIES: hypothetical protein [unclassified Novosphingobium]
MRSRPPGTGCFGSLAAVSENLTARMPSDDHQPGQRAAGNCQPFAHHGFAEQRLSVPDIAAPGQIGGLAGEGAAGAAV